MRSISICKNEYGLAAITLQVTSFICFLPRPYSRPFLTRFFQVEQNVAIPVHPGMRFVLLALLNTALTGAEPWHAISAPTITTQAEAAALVMLAYRVTAEQQVQMSDFGDVQVARVGAEVVVRCDQGTYRLTDNDLLEPWPISAEESVAPATIADQERAAFNVLAGKCRNLPLVPTQITIAAEPSGGWNIKWGPTAKGGSGIRVGGTTPSSSPYRWGRGSWGHRCCGSSRTLRTPKGSG